MLRKISIKLIEFYQSIPGNWHYSCRFHPTCSEYAKEAIIRYGVLKGWFLSIREYYHAILGEEVAMTQFLLKIINSFYNTRILI